MGGEHFIVGLEWKACAGELQDEPCSSLAREGNVIPSCCLMVQHLGMMAHACERHVCVYQRGSPSDSAQVAGRIAAVQAQARNVARRPCNWGAKGQWQPKAVCWNRNNARKLGWGQAVATARPPCSAGGGTTNQVPRRQATGVLGGCLGSAGVEGVRAGRRGAGESRSVVYGIEGKWEGNVRFNPVPGTPGRHAVLPGWGKAAGRAVCSGASGWSCRCGAEGAKKAMPQMGWAAAAVGTNERMGWGGVVGKRW